MRLKNYSEEIVPNKTLFFSTPTFTTPPPPSTLTFTAPPSPSLLHPHLHCFTLTFTAPPSPSLLHPHLHCFTLTFTAPPSPYLPSTSLLHPHLHFSTPTFTAPLSPSLFHPHLHCSTLTFIPPPSPSLLHPHLHPSPLSWTRQNWDTDCLLHDEALQVHCCRIHCLDQVGVACYFIEGEAWFSWVWPLSRVASTFCCNGCDVVYWWVWHMAWFITTGTDNGLYA